ncbi:MAG TPA: class III extradiol ring-cleavage dioxygenase [Burkholderiaceae bacterium]|jgi:4,5-DOPA dioxygenase extradiol|nr:class III extradiol ring-cleavage dioxygenase [Burkholderiaceae bacterium]
MPPTLFLSHGSPMHALHAGRAGQVWAEVVQRLPRPRAILVASAHWETELPMVASATRPETIHDFGGFPRELYRIKYPAPGAPEAARRALALLKDAGFVATANGCRGLDHGAWVPLLHMFPQADVPVAQISLQPALGAAHHLRLGAALAPLAREGVLIVGSGHMTHNLGEWLRSQQGRRAIVESGALPYVEEFRRWVDARLAANDRAALVRWDELAPHARRAHPTNEHFLPLFVALGAAGENARAERLDAGVDSAVLAMDAYLFWP